MEKRAWTARGGPMAEADRLVIRAVADKDTTAARIFVTGEAHESYLGDAAVRLLVGVNDTLYTNGAPGEPLFIQTRADTVQMARFDPAFVWRCFHPGILEGLVRLEAARLGVIMDAPDMQKFDFYESVIEGIRKTNGGPVIPVVEDKTLDNLYNAAYLSCLILFDKPGYMAVPVASHFASPDAARFMRIVKYRRLSAAEEEGLGKLTGLYGHVEALTNPEMNFVVSLYERMLG